MKKGVSRILRKMLIVVLVSVICSQAAMPIFASAASTATSSKDYTTTYKYWSEENAPTLYGTTAIKVPVNTEIDIKHDARFRVFAKDNEDFDLTSEIVAVIKSENGDVVQNIDSSNEGKWSITYTVTDSNGNEVSITVPVEIVEGTAEIWLEKTMYSLPSVDHLNAVGYTRGNNMDRQIIGIFVEVDENNVAGSFSMRKISGEGDLTVPLQNNNGNCESTAIVKGQNDPSTEEGWQVITNTGAANVTHDGSLSYVPTVKTLYKETVPVIYEVKYDSTDKRIKPLHYYHEGDGKEYETQFMNEWKADKDSFAVVDGVTIMALMPYEDAAHVYDSYYRSFSNFDDMFKFWTEVLESYDALIGISYTPEHYWDQAVKTKYFGRANKHGAGSAYYNSGDCIGTNNTYMFTILCPWWGTLHEYGHGYQGNVGNSSYGLPITEVAVNIFAYYIQRLSGIYPIKDENWLGDIDRNETSWNNQRKSGITYYDSEIGSDTALYILINMLNTADDYMEAYSAINQYYREVYFTTGVKMQAQDAWTLVFAEKYNLNLIPYFESWGVTVSDYVYDQMMLSDAEAVYYLDDMVSDSALASQLKTELNKHGEYDLVTTSELADQGLTGTVKITFNISDFENIRNKYLYINDGDTEIAKVQVTSQEMVIELPVGVYKVAPPRGDTPMDFDRLYITVANNTETSYEITYQDLDTSDDGNDIRIQCVGYWGNTYIPFTVETQGDTLLITYRGTRSKAAGTITVLGKDGEIKHTKSVVDSFWTSVLEEPYSIDIEIGDKLTITYSGAISDIAATSLLTGEVLSDYGLNSATKTRTYVYTQYGLVPESMADDDEALYEMFRDRVTSYIESLFEEYGKEYFGNPFVNADKVNEATELVAKLKPEDKAPYAGIFTQGSAPVITFTQDSYTYDVNTFDLKKFIEEEISITDIEENVIDVNSDEVKITSTVDATAEGTYSVQVEVTDKQGNVTIASVTIIVIDPNKPEEPENPGEDPETPPASGGNSFRCKMCDEYEKNKDIPVIGIFYTIIHFFVHLIQSLIHG